MKGERNSSKNKIRKEVEMEKKKYMLERINLREESSDEDSESEIKKLNKNEDKNSLSGSYDGEFVSLDQINTYIEKEKQKKNERGLRRSLLNRKILLEKKDIIYDEKKGELINSFIPSPEELNTFFKHCQVKKLSFEDFTQLPTDDTIDSITFDPNEWMKTNKMDKRIINMEDLSLYCNTEAAKDNQNFENSAAPHIKESNNIINKKEGKTPMTITGEKDKNVQIFKDKKMNDNYYQLQKIISSATLTIAQKNWLNNFIKEINEMDIKEIINKTEKITPDKLELVFDLDNTCIFSFLTHPNYLHVKSKQNIYASKEVKMISFNYDNKVLYSMLIIRKGLKEFLEYAKSFCNFHISTLGAETYGSEIKKILTDHCRVEFDRFKGRIYRFECEKNICDLYIERRNTIVFDDNLRVWNNKSKDNENVIISKFFFDEECAINNENANNEDQINNINIFLNAYRGFNYSKIIDITLDWKSHEIMEYKNIPFYQFKNNTDGDHLNYNKCFTAEYLDSEKFQFIYMKNVIKQIYCLRFVYNIDIDLAIKLIRISTLANIVFCLKYLSDEQKLILTDMIIACGGIILDKKYNISYNEKIYLIASKNIYHFNKQIIKEDLKVNPFFVLLNERFILDTYYFMTNIKENINDPDYIFEDLN